MLSNSRLLLGFICLIATTIAGWLVFVLPAYCSAEAFAQEAAQFQRQAISYTDLANEITQQNGLVKFLVEKRQSSFWCSCI